MKKVTYKDMVETILKEFKKSHKNKIFFYLDQNIYNIYKKGSTYSGTQPNKNNCHIMILLIDKYGESIIRQFNYLRNEFIKIDENLISSSNKSMVNIAITDIDKIKKYFKISSLWKIIIYPSLAFIGFAVAYFAQTIIPILKFYK
ncbi:hypothetical protein [Francisella frigiditurris]|uniref:Uncharacterized protein n=1 Tax=Francisella frigiditurris TaxID=1542390 RepID=A0A1J0KW12_9GAMM|nr:hypothetical protein [Francisella frigiditurris]APC97858.1 hypothetical protein KX01_1463 [Francisella frigiditurris]